MSSLIGIFRFQRYLAPDKRGILATLYRGAISDQQLFLRLELGIFLDVGRLSLLSHSSREGIVCVMQAIPSFFIPQVLGMWYNLIMISGGVYYGLERLDK